MEGSGVFTTYQLTINYRSNQEILDFANIALQNIEANQYAKIQLQANSLKPVTEKSFTDAVHFHYERLAKIKDFPDALPSIMALKVCPYLDQCFARGEKVAFLAYTRQNIGRFESILQHHYQGTKKIVSLIPKKQFNSTIFSMFIKKFWDQVKFIPTQNIMPLIGQEIYNKLDELTFDADKALPTVQKLMGAWRTEQGPTISMWQNQVTNQQITIDEFMDLVKENMLQFEIKNNAIKQALSSARNEENKKAQNIQDADIILSTIHSAKGLEFDNAVILYKNANNMAEPEKRLYYVALTRAMKSEFVLAYDTTASPQIEVDYNTIVKQLHSKAPAQPQTQMNPALAGSILEEKYKAEKVAQVPTSIAPVTAPTDVTETNLAIQPNDQKATSITNTDTTPGNNTLPTWPPILT